MEPTRSGGAPFAVFVGNGYDFGPIGKIEPYGVDAVAVIALARSPDDGDPVVFFHQGPFRSGGKQKGAAQTGN